MCRNDYALNYCKHLIFDIFPQIFVPDDVSERVNSNMIMLLFKPVCLEQPIRTNLE